MLKRQVTTSRELGLGITATPGDEDVCRCSLPWREATSLLERWMLPWRHTNTTKAHPILPLRQHHEGVSQPLVVDLGVVSKPSQTFSGGNHKGRFLSGRLLPPRSLQPPRVIRSMGKSSRLAQITNSFGAKMEKGWIYHLIGQLLLNALKSIGDIRFGVEV